MVGDPDVRKTLLDPWVPMDHQLSRNILPGRQAERRTRSSRFPRTKEILRRTGSAAAPAGAPHGLKTSLDRYEASVARATTTSHRRRRGGSLHGAVPDMHSWAEVQGVDIGSSKTAKRDRRRLELGAGAYKPGLGPWPSPPPIQDRANVNRDQGTPVLTGGRTYDSATGHRKGTLGPEIAALDGFLSDLHGQLESLEQSGRVDTAPAYTKTSNEWPAEDNAGDMFGSVDMYGIPHEVIANAMEV